MVHTSDYTIDYSEGFYDEERDDKSGSRFRWMGRQAKISCFSPALAEKRFLKISAGHDAPGYEPVLEIRHRNRIIGSITVNRFQRDFIFRLPDFGQGQSIADLSLSVDQTYSVYGDPRSFGIMIRSVTLLSSKEIGFFFEGWFPEERDDHFRYHWMGKEGTLILHVNAISRSPYLTFQAASAYGNYRQILTIRSSGMEIVNIPLTAEWNRYDIDLTGITIAGEGELYLTLSVNCVYESPDELRELGIKMANIALHDDREAYENRSQYNENAVLNRQEYLEGKTRLNSYPKTLGIDLYGKCNIVPPCVYCLWDTMKELEGDQTGTMVDDSVLKSYGPFFANAKNLVNCSFGEPLLHPKLDKILSLFSEQGKQAEISTNGQAFSDKAIQALAGSDLTLYVSLDAATKETYARIRNDQWESILPALKKLKALRLANRRLPRIYMVFMPMKVNRHEFEAYFRLCKEIDATALVLRPLNYFENAHIDIERGGYRFVYKDEVLSHDEIRELIAKGERLSRKYALPFINQFEFGETRCKTDEKN